jgi:uncharacterized protein YjbJ (UPF0337 family)
MSSEETSQTNQQRRQRYEPEPSVGQWKQLREKVKEKWGDLTDDDLDKIEGKRDQLIGKIQQRYGIAKPEAEKRVDQWANELIEQ